MHSYRRHLGDYAKDTGALTQADHGAYTLLIDHYYSTESPLPLDMDDLYAIGKAGSSAEKRAVDRVLAKFFAKEPDGYHQKRIDAEIVEYLERAAINSENGRIPKGKQKGSESLPYRYAEGEPKGSLAISHKPEAKGKTQAAPAAPPDWLPSEPWKAFVEMRTRGRNRFTEYAKGLTIKRLESLRADGEDVRAVLEQSVMRGWSGVFPVRPDSKGSGGMGNYL